MGRGCAAARMGKPDVTIVGLGSLLSERSSRTTFPNLANFRLARIDGYRRVLERHHRIGRLAVVVSATRRAVT